MKNIFKIATISALVMLSANTMAEDANQDFTWTGTVPAAGAGTGIKIISAGSGAAFDAGEFTLTKVSDDTGSAGMFAITSANTLSFDVVRDDASEEHVDYYYTLTNFLAVSSHNPSNFFNANNRSSLTANGIPLQKDIKTTTAATTLTNLTLTQKGVSSQYAYGTEFTFRATLLITDQAI
ncbi:hypothetical protein Sps_03961 [Shewanella psychrophila]|uniref:MatB fimbrillin n=1 Tax=Shewanella psychrophila TaxID=225848 RepID=A0A1S6HU40_9GAMM|nr:hypothetical protein [Shewanella psychrophila]AQS39076.1 hypothetical protein Sps_03961 [Shewanella psychrophila]